MALTNHSDYSPITLAAKTTQSGMYRVKYFEVDTHKPIPGLSTAPMSCADAEAVKRDCRYPLYAIIVAA